MQRSKWTQEELLYLKENWGNKSRTALANTLGRSKSAISSKALELKLGYQVDNTDGIPITLLPELIGVTHANIHKTWIRELGMKVKKLGKGISYVTEKDLTNFMKEHRNLWVASKCDKKFFQIYDWFMQALDDEKNCKVIKGQQKEWTQEEINQLYILRKRGFTFKQIGEQLHRSKSGCLNKYRRYYGEDK